MKSRNLVLTGFMGSGKTSIGLRLSYRLQIMVEDTDKLIERREGRSISDIFAREGEEYFRQQETALLKELTEWVTPVREENRQLLGKLGLVVYLRARPETIYERLKGDVTRPLLQCADPLGRIRELMEGRSGAYEACAHIIVDVDGKTVEEIMDIIEREAEACDGRP